MRDPYLYPNSDVLKNMANIQDEQLFRDFEADYTVYRLSEIVTEELIHSFNFEALCDLHHHIFRDIFEWAGKPRIINVEKAEAVLGELSIEYSDCFEIEKDAEQILKKMSDYNWKEESLDNIAKNFSDFLAELWKVHPYREGNTRTIVTFCSMFIESQGIFVDSELFKDNAAYMREALVAATATFHDLGDLRKPEYLYQIVKDALERGR